MIDDALEVMDELAPTLAFLAALLVLAEGCRRAGLFAAAGPWLGEARVGAPRALQRRVFVLACAVTAVLSLDATVLLLTPVVLTAVRRARVDAAPPLLATVHLANSASLLLLISNLTNLLAFRASELSFAHFTLLMTLPWLVAIAIEWRVLRPATDPQLGKGSDPLTNTATTADGLVRGSDPGPKSVSWFAVGVVGATLTALVAPIGPAAVLAALIGLNAGPNLTPHGSLATVLWRRVLREHDAEVPTRAFLRAGLLATPAVLVLSTAALWLAVQVTP